MKGSTMNEREKRTARFREKNLRRKEHKDEGTRGAKALRRAGVSRPEKVTIPMPYGDDITTTEMVAGVSGAFGWATKEEWNERIPGTAGCERV